MLRNIGPTQQLDLSQYVLDAKLRKKDKKKETWNYFAQPDTKRKKSQGCFINPNKFGLQVVVRQSICNVYYVFPQFAPTNLYLQHQPYMCTIKVIKKEFLYFFVCMKLLKFFLTQ